MNPSVAQDATHPVAFRVAERPTVAPHAGLCATLQEYRPDAGHFNRGTTHSSQRLFGEIGFR
jgi:hypothetical protein